MGKVQLNINISSSLRDKLKQEARKNGKTMTDFIIENLSNIENKSENSSSYIDKLECRLKNLELHLGLINQKEPFVESDAENITAFDQTLFFGFANHHNLGTVETWNSLAPHISFLSEKEQLRFKEVLGGFSTWTVEELDQFTNDDVHSSCPLLKAFEEWAEIKLPSLEEIRLRGKAMRWPFN